MLLSLRHLRTQREGSYLQASLQNLTRLANRSQTAASKTLINSSSGSHPACGTLSWQPQQTNRAWGDGVSLLLITTPLRRGSERQGNPPSGQNSRQCTKPPSMCGGKGIYMDSQRVAIAGLVDQGTRKRKIEISGSVRPQKKTYGLMVVGRNITVSHAST